MIIRIRLFVVVVSLLIPSLLVGQTKSEDAVWKLLSSKDVETLEFQPGAPATGLVSAFLLDQPKLIDILKTAPREFSAESKTKTTIVFIPFPDGTYQRFRVEASPVINRPLESAGNETHTYKGVGMDDPSATIRFERAFDGFHALIRSSLGTFYIDPPSTKERRQNANTYFSYFAGARPGPPQRLHCEVSGDRARQDRRRMSPGRRPAPAAQAPEGINFVPQDLHVYKIAVAANSFYVLAVYDNSLSASPYD